MSMDKEKAVAVFRLVWVKEDIEALYQFGALNSDEKFVIEKMLNAYSAILPNYEKVVWDNVDGFKNIGVFDPNTIELIIDSADETNVTDAAIRYLTKNFIKGHDIRHALKEFMCDNVNDIFKEELFNGSYTPKTI